MMKNRSALLIAFVSLTTAAGVLGQQRNDPQSSYEPRSAPGDGQKFLAQMAGDWVVTKTFYPRTGKPDVAKGECKQTMINGGRFLKSEFTFHADAGDTTGLGLIGYESETGKFTSVWIDSRQTRMSIRQSKDRFNGKEILLFSKSLEEGNSSPRQSRTITQIEDPGNKIVHRQYTAAADGKERLVMELVMTRKS